MSNSDDQNKNAAAADLATNLGSSNCSIFFNDVIAPWSLIIMMGGTTASFYEDIPWWKGVVLVAGAFLALGLVFVGLLMAVMFVGRWNQKWRARLYQKARQKVESAYPETRAKRLSSGKWLLTSRATGKTVEEIDWPARN